MTRTDHQYAEAKARTYFRALAARIERLDRDRRRCQDLMLGLASEFRRTIRRSGIILYVKRIQKKDPPCGLYWGIFWNAYQFLRRRRKGPTTGPDSAPAPGPPVKHPPLWRHVAGNLTSKQIYQFGRWKIRAFYRDFDRRRIAANAAYRDVTLALERIRKILLTRYPLGEDLTTWPLLPDFPGSPVPPAPLALFPEVLTLQSGNALGAGWRLVFLTAAREEELIELSRRHNAAAPDPRLSLSFATDSHATYGRARWRLGHTARHLDTLTERTMRQIRIPQSVRRRIHPYEQLRRAITRSHRTLTRVLVRINTIAGGALYRADIKRQEAATPNVTLDRSLLEHRDGPGATTI